MQHRAQWFQAFDRDILVHSFEVGDEKKQLWIIFVRLSAVGDTMTGFNVTLVHVLMPSGPLKTDPL